MKKYIGLVVVLTLLVSMFAGCTKKEETPTAPAETTPESTEPAAATDAVTTASVVTEGPALISALSADGAWLAATLNDITLTEDLVVEGEFMNKDKIARKLAPYTQDAEHNITASFTITAPRMIVKSENFKFQGGTFIGDIYVEANGFQVATATVKGNIYYATEAYMQSAVISEDSNIENAQIGGMAAEATDAVTTASIVTDGPALINALSAKGTWLAATLNNITLTEDLVVEGEFTNKDKIARKLAPYTQDADHNITGSFIIRAPKMIVKSENFKFQGGTFVGDIYVEANGFQLSTATVDGNVYYASQAIMDSAVLAEDAVVTGVKEVK
ncbi:polymer-forming cytoskeletal protein [Fusibacter sp. 3D3]|uniref:polymer-forming cytoskeletal protein n=1 Tax=Fusibacter sp. 3D3 TaxID=1048380 RepID=UPI0008538777|nr:polymer-forming cytoskeletal protein [Fusibacter sp. 3D3]GAU77333.1 putative lipoprotein [Fusibacter sp. 3D3]